MNSSLMPRLATSKKWTNLPLEFTEKVQIVFAEEFEPEAASGEFLVEGRIYPEEVVIRVGYLEKGRLKQVNFEASMDLPKRESDSVIRDESELGEDGSKTMERLYICIDAVGSLLEEYFDLDADEGEELDVPYRWKAYRFEGETVYLQHSTVNSRLEAEADRLLGLGDPNLVQDPGETDDALGKAEVDSELAFEVQKAIRTGKFKPTSPDADPETELN